MALTKAREVLVQERMISVLAFKNHLVVPLTDEAQGWPCNLHM